MLTALQPSVKPLADVVGRYIRCDGQNKRKNIRHTKLRVGVCHKTVEGREYCLVVIVRAR